MPSIDHVDYVNLGSFKADVICTCRSKFDPVLHKHLKTCKMSTYASYLSKYAHSDFITVFFNESQRAIDEEAENQGKFVTADEVTDHSNTEQLAIVRISERRGDSCGKSSTT